MTSSKVNPPRFDNRTSWNIKTAIGHVASRYYILYIYIYIYIFVDTLHIMFFFVYHIYIYINYLGTSYSLTEKYL